jgi:hypothetical protein
MYDGVVTTVSRLKSNCVLPVQWRCERRVSGSGRIVRRRSGGQSGDASYDGCRGLRESICSETPEGRQWAPLRYRACHRGGHTPAVLHRSPYRRWGSVSGHGRSIIAVRLLPRLLPCSLLPLYSSECIEICCSMTFKQPLIQIWGFSELHPIFLASN